MKTPYSDSTQYNEISKLVNILGICIYRDTKAELGLNRMKPFKHLTRLEADILIEEMKKQNEIC